MVKSLGGDGSIGYRAKFDFEDGYSKTLRVVGSKYKKYDSLTIQITKVIDDSNYIVTKDGILYPYRYVYEEIDSNDFVIYCRFMGKDNIMKNYPWARELFK